MNENIVIQFDNFLEKYIDNLHYYEGAGIGILNLPKFDLLPRDFLFFAEEELIQFENSLDSQIKERSLINCVAYLKRAIDCALDLFLSAFGMLDYFNKKNLRFPQKMNYLEGTGIFSSRSLRQLNIIRNKMEHEFLIPKIENIELVFELTSGFVAVIERTISQAKNTEATFYYKDDEHKYNISIGVTFKYDHKMNIIQAKWWEDEQEYWWKDEQTDPNLLKVELGQESYHQFLHMFCSLDYFTGERNEREERLVFTNRSWQN